MRTASKINSIEINPKKVYFVPNNKKGDLFYHFFDAKDLKEQPNETEGDLFYNLFLTKAFPTLCIKLEDFKLFLKEGQGKGDIRYLEFDTNLNTVNYFY
jgi:hypothetical protein